MHLGGFQKNSLIDFPGHVACLVFTTGCNFICPYCHNPDLAAGPVSATAAGAGSPYDQESVFNFLEKRKGMIQGVAITGGEPTLQPDLIDFCTRIREMGFKVKLDSNGTRPKILSKLFDKDLVDYIAMDIKTSLDQYPSLIKGNFDLKKINRSIELVMDRAPAYEFRTTCVRPFVNEEIMGKIAEMIRGADRYVLQKCSSNIQGLDPDFLKEDKNFFSDDGMLALKAIAEKTIDHVILR